MLLLVLMMDTAKNINTLLSIGGYEFQLSELHAMKMTGIWKALFLNYYGVRTIVHFQKWFGDTVEGIYFKPNNVILRSWYYLLSISVNSKRTVINLYLTDVPICPFFPLCAFHLSI